LGKLRVLSGADVCRILRAHGFAEVRQRGSHVVMQKAGADGTVTVPVPKETPAASPGTVGMRTTQPPITAVGKRTNVFGSHRTASGI
jgi:predicted RNA binding protein YcfA (HicA-like mRNA interferase family)